MKTSKDEAVLAHDLRRQAERLIHQLPPEPEPPATEETVRKQLHELQVSQIELEMQNRELQRAQQEIQDLLTRYTELYDFAPIGYCTLDRFGVLLETNLAGAKLLGLTRSELLGSRLTHFVHPQSRASFDAFLQRVFSDGGRKSCEVELVAPDRQPLHVHIDADAEASGATCRAVMLDITKKKESEVLIWQQANFDTLTGLPNRNMFLNHLEQEIKKSQRARLLLGLMFLDLDRFKDINDTLGHGMGDLLLQEMAQRLRSCVRDTDMVARLGGDEFTIVMGELENYGAIERVADAILSKLTQPFHLAETVIHVSASIGITLYPTDAVEIDKLVRNADQAMYAAKNQGRNRFHYFTPALQDVALARMRLINDLRHALAGNEFELFYQPIVDMASGTISKAEALLRWRHPTRGLIRPAEFIPIAEDIGIIVDIGNWVIREAGREAARCRAAHGETFQVSINMSPVQFLCSPRVQYPVQGLAAGLAVEITEGLLLDASPTVTDQLIALRDAGIQVALDDFGTGYSSLSYLKKFDIDYIKIDRSFVHNLAADSDDMALCEAIIVMAHKLGLKVVSEGIETELQRKLLSEVGCDYGQGYLYSKAVPAAEFEQLLDAGTS
jgi:diguanylate cyclase (GGDEF)-like protein/PAS domain S-box-containing protein